MEKKIKDLPYLISDSGEVKNANSKRIKKPTIDNMGYCRVGLWNAQKCAVEVYYVHKLVADYFLDEPEGIAEPVIKFVDGDKNNCSADNLAWVNKTEFISDEHYKEGGSLNAYWNSVKKPVRITDSNQSKDFNSITEAARWIAESNGLNFDTVRRRCSQVVNTKSTVSGFTIYTI